MGEKELSPQELWDVLTRYGQPVTAISHTGATGMGTDWNIFESIDHRVENVVEIYQGARVSYEGRNAPQPTVGLREGERYNAAATLPAIRSPAIRSAASPTRTTVSIKTLSAVVHKLGVWANSDHISTHTSYGGVYVKEFTREGIIEGLNARRTIAATDKIFIEFTCNGHLLGTEIEVDRPTIAGLEDRRNRGTSAGDAGPQRRELPAVETWGKDVRAIVRRRVTRHRRESLLSSRRAEPTAIWRGVLPSGSW